MMEIMITALLTSSLQPNRIFLDPKRPFPERLHKANQTDIERVNHGMEAAFLDLDIEFVLPRTADQESWSRSHCKLSSFRLVRS